MNAIGLDIGTTSICAIRLNCETGVAEKILSANNTSWLPSSEKWEKIQNANIIFDTVLNLLESIADSKTAAIGVTGQMHGIVYLDNSGNAVSPLYTWQDERGNLIYTDKKTYAEYLNSFAGYGNVTHFYNLKNGLLPSNADTYCTIHSYVASRLAGIARPLIHISDAASFGCYDIQKNEFIEKNLMQPLITSLPVMIGKWRNIPVCVAIGDNQASFIGSGCNKNSVLVNIGTGSQISFAIDKPIECNGLEIRPLYSNQLIAVGSSLCGGRAYAALENFFGKILDMVGAKHEDLYEAMTDTVRDMNYTDLNFCTLLCGTRNTPKLRGSITNLGLNNFTPADFILSTLTGIANELFQLYNSSNAKSTRLIGSGNGIRKNTIMQRILSHTFGMMLNIPKLSEEAAVGAALFSSVACGIYKDIVEAQDIIHYY